MKKFKFNFYEGVSAEQNYVVNREKSHGMEEKRLSQIAKHIKNKRKIAKALQDINENHNWSWFLEMYDRNKDNLDLDAMNYRRYKKITYDEMFEKAIQIAKTLKTMGVEKGTEIPMCVSNVPEMIEYLFAISMIGAKANIFGADYAPDYIEEIIAGCDPEQRIFIATDDNYGAIKDIVDQFYFQNKLVISLADSLPNGKDPFEKWDKEFQSFENKAASFQRMDPNIFSMDEFIKFGENYQGEVIDRTVGLDDEFTITYSSGSTKTGRPKAIVHTNRSFITMARFHDPDISRLPKMRDMISMAHIPPHSNTDLITSISDTFSQKCTVACEPIYHEDFFAKAMLINQPDYVPATRSHWIRALKQFETDEELKQYDLSFFKMPVSVGEAIAPNEEKYINRRFKELKAGCAKLPKPLAPVTISVGGGDCEHGGLFYTIFKELREKISFPREDFGLVPFQSVECAVLRPDGTECGFYELGRLVANSPGNMQYYKNNQEATDKFFVTDAYGKTWGDCSVWSYINKKGNPAMKGRIGDEFTLTNGVQVPTFVVADTILKDTKNILSCEVVNVKDEEGKEIPVAHIEFQPNKQKSEANSLMSAELRVQALLPTELSEKVVYRVHSYEEGFPLTGCGKRKVLALEEEGLTPECIIPIVCNDNNVHYCHPYDYDRVHDNFESKGPYIKK